MVSLVSDNTASSLITSVLYTRMGLNRADNILILDETPDDELVRATEQWQLCVDYSQNLTPKERPALKTKYMEGPFVLNIYNNGVEISKSMLIFDLVPAVENKVDEGIITEDPMDWTSRSLAVLPFIDVFRTQIDKEAERSARLISASKTPDLNQVRALKEQEAFLSHVAGFFAARSSFDKQTPAERPVGKAAVSDELASSLSAGADFYDAVWTQMVHMFEPSFRYIGEQYALGNVSLEPPAFVRK